MPLDNTDVTLLTALPTLTPASAQTNDIVPVFRPGQSTPLQQATLNIQPIRVAIAVFKNGGSVLAVGDQVALYFPMACTITEAALFAPHESGSAVVDIWKTPKGSFPATVANTICASDLPTLVSAQEESDTTLTGWTTTISAGDTLTFNLNSVTSFTNLTVALTVKTT